METAIRDMCKKVARNGLLDVSEKAIVDYQDMIGHATEEENKSLANDPALMESYYRIYGVAYGTIAAIKFYMANSNKVYNMKAELDDYKEELDKVRAMHKSSEERAKFWEDKTEEYKGQLKEAKRDMEGTEKRLQLTEAEVIALKAKLYDLTNDVAELTQRLSERSE